ncbi:ATP-binding cassette domain-containing protein [Pseudothioglobus sp. nBUS_23]|uniref:ATP-binding cassette domain-containing protein n=1 Tax=Pseudothioglobus sp. nBUS_23 TaxID=3395318 RepID=UPI003EB93081
MVFLRNLSKSKIKESIVSRNREYVLSLIANTSINNFKKIDANIVQSYLSVEGERVAQIVLSFTNLISALLVILLFSIYLIYLDYFLLVFLGLTSTFLYLMLQNSYKKSKIYGKALSDTNTSYIKYIQNIMTEKVFFMLSKIEAVNKGLSVDVVKKLHLYQFEIQKRMAYIEFVIKTSTMLSILFVVYIFYIQEFELSLILFIGVMFVRLIPFMNQFGNALQNLKSNIPLIDKLMQIESIMKKVKSVNLEDFEINELKVISKFLISSFSEKNSYEVTMVPGNIYGLYGPSGIGKTTLAESMLGLNTFKDSKVLLNNELIVSSIKSQTILKNSLYMSQHIIPNEFTIGELFKDIDSNKINNLFSKLQLDSSNLTELYLRKLSSFSGGEQQRLSFIYALLSEKKIIIFDEPSSAINEDISLIMLDLLRDYVKEYNAIVVIISHDSVLKANIDSFISISEESK